MTVEKVNYLECDCKEGLYRYVRQEITTPLFTIFPGHPRQWEKTVLSYTFHTHAPKIFPNTSFPGIWRGKVMYVNLKGPKLTLS